MLKPFVKMTVTVDAAKRRRLWGFFRRLTGEDKTGWINSVWKHIASVFYRHEKALFDSEGATGQYSHDGTGWRAGGHAGRWPELDPEYAEWKNAVAPGAKILQLRASGYRKGGWRSGGSLLASLTSASGNGATHFFEPGRMGIGTNVPPPVHGQGILLAQLHHEGASGMTRPVGRPWGKNKSQHALATRGLQARPPIQLNDAEIRGWGWIIKNFIKGWVK